MSEISMKTKSLVPFKVTETFVFSTRTFLMLQIERNALTTRQHGDHHGGMASLREEFHPPQLPEDQNPGLAYLCFSHEAQYTEDAQSM